MFVGRRGTPRRRRSGHRAAAALDAPNGGRGGTAAAAAAHRGDTADDDRRRPPPPHVPLHVGAAVAAAARGCQPRLRGYQGKRQGWASRAVPHRRAATVCRGGGGGE